jgi:hypothetical protein
MLAEVAVLKEQVRHLTDLLEKQERVLHEQDKILKELVALAERGKGSLWMFITLGGLLGAVMSNFRGVIQFFTHP